MKRLTAGPKDRVLVCDGVSAREFDGEWVVLDLRQGNYFGLDDLGGMIWSHLAQGRSAEEIVELLVPGYDVVGTTFMRDLLALVDELLDRDLIRLGE